MTVQNVFDNFITSRYTKGCSDKTLDSYINLTRPFLSFLGSDFDIENLAQEHIQNFINHLFSLERQGKLSRASSGSYIRNAKIFLRWYYEVCQDIEPPVPVHYRLSAIHIPRMPKKMIRLYSPEDIQTIFNSVEASPAWLISRNKAMIALMLDSGLRQSEVAGLILDNIDFVRTRLKVTGKGAKDRFVPLGKYSIHLLEEYLSVRPFDSSIVFVSIHGSPITCGAIKSMTGDLQRRLPFEFSSHKLRHNFATNFLINQYTETGQMDIYALMAILGHEDTLTTQRYLHEAQSIIASAHCISHLDKIFETEKKTENLEFSKPSIFA